MTAVLLERVEVGSGRTSRSGSGSAPRAFFGPDRGSEAMGQGLMIPQTKRGSLVLSSYPAREILLRS